MGRTRPLYLMISRTDTGMGRMIRAVSRYPYNHVSLTLDPSLQNWFSFARYSRDFPLYGGFIAEHPERYLTEGSPRVRIFRLEIAEDRARRLEDLFARAGSGDNILIYNTFDAMASAFGRNFRLPNAYTCLSFACAVLELRCRTIREMDLFLSPYLCYEGPLSALVSDSGRRDDAYFQRLGLMRGSWRTVRHFASLSGRVLHRGRLDLVAVTLNL